MKKKFKVGDLVFLRSESKWNNGSISNPLNVIGEVTRDGLLCWDLTLKVEWCNGKWNHYGHADLKEATDSEIVESLSLRLGYALAKLGIKS